MPVHKAALLTIALLIGSPAHAQPLAQGGTQSGKPDLTKDEMRRSKTACAVEWQQRKREGATGSMLWRDFFDNCHARRMGRGAVSPKK